MRILESEPERLVVHATAPASELSAVVLWLGGTPHTGALLEPVVAAAANVEREVVSVARPGYGGARRRKGRSVADAADDAAGVIELLGLEDVIVVGYSGGGPHAIAAGAARPRQTRAVLTFGCIGPYDGTAEWFTGMADPSGLAAAAHGLAARTAHPDDFDTSSFNARDYATLEGEWSDLALDAQASHHHGPAGAIDDDLAFVRPWGFSLDDCTVPVVLVQGEQDRVIPVRHAHAIAALLPAATAVIHPHEGHVSILRALDAQLRDIARDR